MNMYKFLKIVSICIVLILKHIKATKTNHNILLIVVDDLRPLSTENIHLPNIMKMAARGVNFKNAFAQQALCAPSRNSMLTGRRPDSLRLYDFYSYWRDTVGNFTTMPQYFKENGYETFSVGKVFHPGKSSNYTDDYPYSWTHVPYHPPSDIYKDAAVCKDSYTKNLQRNLICPVNIKSQPEHTLPDLQTLDYAVNILKNRNVSKPFFLAVGFHKPHIPLKFPRRFLHQVPINNVHPPKHPNISQTIPLVALHPWTDVRSRDDIKRLNISFPLGIMPEKWTLKIRRSYYAAAKFIDALIGEILNYVDMRKNIIILTSDHGWSLGENGLWAKYSNFDTALKVPLIILAPELHHKTIHCPVELIDIFPTLIQLTNLKPLPPCSKDRINKCLDGKNLLTKSDSLPPWSKDRLNKCIQGSNLLTKTNFLAFSQYPRPSAYPQRNSDKPRLNQIKIMGYSLRTQYYRYTEWVAFNSSKFEINWNKTYGIELYDHRTDIYESNNLNLEPKYNKIKTHLAKLLRSHVDPN